MTTLDIDLLRRRRRELALSQRAVAAACDCTTPVIVSLEAGRNHDELTVAFLTRLADTLAVDIRSLHQTADPAEPSERTDDPATVGSALVATGVLTPITGLAESLGWTLERTRLAVDQLEQHLPAVGMRLHRLEGRVAIRRADEPIDAPTLAGVVRAHIARDGLNLTEASLLATIINDGPPRQLGNAQAVALGVLTNAGLVTTDDPRTATAEATTVASAAVRFSLMVDGDGMAG